MSAWLRQLWARHQLHREWRRAVAEDRLSRKREYLETRRQYFEIRRKAWEIAGKPYEPYQSLTPPS